MDTPHRDTILQRWVEVPFVTSFCRGLLLVNILEHLWHNIVQNSHIQHLHELVRGTLSVPLDTMQHNALFYAENPHIKFYDLKTKIK